MLILAIIIYLIFAFTNGPFWPLEALGGKAGPFGVLLVIVWVVFLIIGLSD